MKVKTKKLERKKLSTENKEVKQRKDRTVNERKDSYEKNQGKEMRRD